MPSFKANPESASADDRAIIRGVYDLHTEEDFKPQAQAIETGPRTWLKAMFPVHFNQPFGEFHVRFWTRMWELGQHDQPLPLLIPWSRAYGKSLCIEAAAIMLGARRRRRYILYFSNTQPQANSHVRNIAHMLGRNPATKRYYPELATAQVNEVTGSKTEWSRQRIVTAAGLVIDALSIATLGARGLRFDEIRPDAIFYDDVDSINDSIAVVKKKIAVIGGSIVASGQENTYHVFAQNPIHEDSVVSQIMDGRAGIINEFDIIGPIKALKSYKIEKKIKTNGQHVYRLKDAVSNWAGFSLARAQKDLNMAGVAYFEREYQHNTKIKTGSELYPTYSPIHHLVTMDEFFGKLEKCGFSNLRDRDGKWVLPYHWQKGLGLDFGTTPQHPSVLKWLTTPGEFEPFKDLWIWYRELCLPRFPQSPGEIPDPVSPMRIARHIRRLEAKWREDDNMQIRVMSHEQSAALNTFVHDEAMFTEEQFDGLMFQKRRGNRISGIAQMQNRFEIDPYKPHPFKVYPNGYKMDIDGNGKLRDVSGMPLIGCPLQIFLVGNGQGELYLDDEKELVQYGAINDDGQVRSRWERPKYKNASNQFGEEKANPVTINNDACFVAGTLINTQRGEIPIEKVAKGDLVWTRKGFKPTTGSFITSQAATVFEVKFRDGCTLIGTGNHPVWIESGWQRLDALGDFAEVLTVSELSEKQQVYNLTVKECPEYYANGILVHNCDAERYLAEEFGVANADAEEDEKEEKDREREEADNRSEHEKVEAFYQTHAPHLTKAAIEASAPEDQMTKWQKRIKEADRIRRELFNDPDSQGDTFLTSMKERGRI